MPRVERPDGAEIHWTEQGSGPLVVLAPYTNFHPSVYDAVAADLGADHRLVRYDDRGTGESSPHGPHDMETGAADMAAVIEAAGGPAVVLGLVDAANRAIRVCARSPELVHAVVIGGGIPADRRALEGSDAMAASDTVVDAFLSMVETDYRGALRSLVTAANTQMSEDEVRRRVQLQAEYQPQEVAVARLRAWVDDEALEPARACGDRLWLLYAESLGGGWFPSGGEAVRLARRLFPDAHVMEIEEGIVSRPDLVAGMVRRITAPVRATPA
jgi:pimeloyl-ACP methyl ester carboxylesterase